MRNILKFFAASLSVTVSNANAEQWVKTFGGSAWDWGECVLQTSDGGYIALGGTKSWESRGSDLLLVKTNSHGDTSWRKTYGEKLDDYGVRIKEGGNACYVILGMSKFSVYNTYEQKSIWLLKTNSQGETLWTVTFKHDSISFDEPLDDFGYDFVKTSDGGYAVAGETSIIHDTTDLWLFKVDSLGQLIWQKTYGEEGYDRAEGIAPTSDGGFMIVGATQSYGGAQNDLWLLRTDSLGDTLWTKTYGDPDYDWGSSIKPLSDGGFIIAGQKRIYGENQYNGWLLRIDSLGDTLWTRIYGKKGWDTFRDVERTKDGYIITGETNSYTNNDTTPSVWLIKTNYNGWCIWSRTFGGQDWDWGSYVQETSDGGYIVTGGTCSYGAGESDVWLLKTDADGYVAVGEGQSPDNPVKIEFVSDIGSYVILRFKDIPEGFRVQVFDASGRKVDEIHSTQTQGSITWGQGFSPGVYFIRCVEGNQQTQKKILVK